jgi:hypothetical protein
LFRLCKNGYRHFTNSHGLLAGSAVPACTLALD